jgi:hypothetical protein
MAGGQAYIKKPFVSGPATSGYSGFSGASGSGVSGSSGLSGFSGMGGSGVSGTSGFSGTMGSGLNFGTRAYVDVDEQIKEDPYANWGPAYPWVTEPGPPMYFPPDVVVPVSLTPSTYLNLSLEANQTYIIRGLLRTEISDDDYIVSGHFPADQPLATSWHYTGVLANFALFASQPNFGIVFSRQWDTLDQIYPYGGGSTNWYIDGAAGACVIEGTVETTTSGILTLNWYPYGQFYYALGVISYAMIKRGSYLQADSFSTGASSGASGFSGQDAVLSVGTWMGI